jgi:hypothetical protein
MARYVKLFFLNGGTTCFVMRIANGAKPAFVTLKSEAKADALALTARNPGLLGNSIRAAVTYDTDQPEATFNLELFRWSTDASGNTVKSGSELWRNLSMNPTSPLYAEAFLTQNSALATASDLSAKAPGTGFSQAGRVVDYGANFAAAWKAILTPAACSFQMTVGANRAVTVDLSSIIAAAPIDEAAFLGLLNPILVNALSGLPTPPVVTASFVAAPPRLHGGVDTPKWLRFASVGNDVFISPAASNDLAIPLMLGTLQGGYEVGAWSASRPAPTGTTIVPSQILGAAAGDFAILAQGDITALNIAGTVISPLNFHTTANANDAMYVDGATTSSNGSRDGIREKLRIIQQAVANIAAATPAFTWTADIWGYRLAFRNTAGADNGVGVLGATGWTGFAAKTTDRENVRYYSLGNSGTGDFQTPGAPAGSDGGAPQASDYAAAYPIIDREVDLFNLMVLPSANGVDQKQLWSAASVFCQQRRAFLIMDPSTSWVDAQTAAAQVPNLRIGVVKDYSAVYFPRLTINENGLSVNLGPSGAVAGVMARIDGSRGVWKAPAGIEADLRGISGLEKRFSDPENGLLNPQAINTLRIFPDGVVVWGARTNFGSDSSPNDYKYVPIRRLALFMEESLYRGLKWVVFEPNDEPLWAQIRLNVGSFMHSLFMQGAFQGSKPNDAYFVRCDSETTTQDDRNKGIVNIWVGFAPLKPAEFVVLYLQQMAGQIQV